MRSYTTATPVAEGVQALDRLVTDQCQGLEAEGHRILSVSHAVVQFTATSEPMFTVLIAYEEAR